MKVWILLAILLILSIPAYAEISGSINFTFVNATTGLYGYTVDTCNATADCHGLFCYGDYDNISTGNSYGWCNLSATTYCFHNGTAFSSGQNSCATNMTYRTCNMISSGGNWSIAQNCTTGYTCDTQTQLPANCTAPSSPSTGNNNGGGGSSPTTLVGSIIFTSSPLDFDIVQGTSVTKQVSVRNNGNKTLYNITISVSGISWYSVSPAKSNQSTRTNETTFTINFSAPADVAVASYPITLRANTHDSSVTASKAINIAVKPSTTTVQEQIIPDYSSYLNILSSLKQEMTALENSGKDVEELRGLLLNAERKLNEASQFIEVKDYAAASQSIDDAKGVLDAATALVNEIKSKPPAGLGDLGLAAIIGVAAVVIVFLSYLLLPPKKEKGDLEKTWLKTDEKKSFFRKTKKKKD